KVNVVAPGNNGKMNEVSAAMELLQLDHIDQALEVRARIYNRYADAFAGIPTSRLQNIPENLEWNHAYCPLFVRPEHSISRDDLYMRLKEQKIHARRYFYPLVSSFPMYRGLSSAEAHNLPIATSLAEQVICLPMYPTLTEADQDRMIEIILRH